MIPTALLLDVLTWIALGVFDILALLGNGFIIAVNGHQWLQKKKMVPYIFLLTSLSTSRFLMQMASTVAYILYLISPKTYLYSSRMEAITFIWMFFNIVTHCCATWLSIFYCVKVTNFANCLFLWMKPRIGVLVPRLLGMSVVISTVFFFPFVGSYLRDKKECTLTVPLPRNTNESEVCKNIFNAFLPAQFFFASINFSLTLITSILLLTSLWKHTRNLKESSTAVKDLSTQVHIKVMKPLFVSLFFYIFYFFAIVIAIGNIFKLGSTERLVSEILLSLYALVHSITLILINPKLKAAAACILNIRQRAL